MKSVATVQQKKYNEIQDAVTEAAVTRDWSYRASAAHDGQKLHGTKCVVAFVSQNEMHRVDYSHKAVR